MITHTDRVRKTGSGSDIRLVQTMLGHQSLASTQIYTAFEPRRAIDAVEIVDALLAEAAALPQDQRDRVTEALRRIGDGSGGPDT